MTTPSPFWKSPTALALVVAISIAGFLLYEEHAAHLWGALPYLILLACPLMHVFMHHGHRGHDHGAHDHEHSTDQRR